MKTILQAWVIITQFYTFNRTDFTANRL